MTTKTSATTRIPLLTSRDVTRHSLPIQAAPRSLGCLMQIATLGSGSKGNALFVKTKGARLLVDAGLTAEEILERLAFLREDASQLTAIVITHTHADHAKSARKISDQFNLPVWAHARAFGHPSMKKIARKQAFSGNERFHVGDCEFLPIPLSHDADPTFAFRIEAEGASFGIATDLGRPTDNVRRDLAGCDAVLLEFNHDLRMLETGPYPWHLKKRVGGDLGHLSNDQAADLLQSLLHAGLRHLTLGHLSETNNRPEIAQEVAQRVVVGTGMNKTVIAIAPQSRPGLPLDLAS